MESISYVMNTNGFRFILACQFPASPRLPPEHRIVLITIPHQSPGLFTNSY